MIRRPIRARVTIAFTAAMAVILAAFGTFLYLRTSSELDESVNDTLELRAGDTESIFATTGKGGNGLQFDSIDPEDSFSQVISASGQVRFSTSQLSVGALTSDELARAHEGSITLERGGLDPLDGRVRILARPVEGSDRPAVSVVGVSLEDRDGSLRTLAAMLLLGLPAALLLSSAAGYWAAGRALGPVETMRREAAMIGSAPSKRLAVPAPDDELRRLATTLNEMLDRLEAAIDRERQFADDASHELRTPLALHKAELEVALRYGGSEAELRAAIESGVQEVDRLARLAEDLLLVARSGEPGLPLTSQRLDPEQLLERVVARFANRAARDGRAIHSQRCRRSRALRRRAPARAGRDEHDR